MSSTAPPPSPQGKTRVLLVGIDPISGTLKLPDMDGRALAAQLDTSVARMRAEPDLVVDTCYMLPEQAAPAELLRAQLKRAAPYDVLMVGNGLRALPPFSRLFEDVLEVVRAAAPCDTRVLCSTTPSDHLETLRVRVPRREL